MTTDIIKEYLVGLGFKVDNNTFAQAQKAMGSAENTVKKFASGSVAQFAAASVAVTAFVAATATGIAKFAAELANADLENEKFARLMWTSKDNAVAYQAALGALGATVKDLYLSPELMKKYQELRKEAFELRPPAEYSEQMKGVRSITFEFQRLKLEATYAMQWIGYYFTKYIEGPAGRFKTWLQNLNESISTNMPKWTKQVAQVGSWFIRAAEAVVEFGKDIKNVFSGLSTETKLTGGIIAGVFAMMKAGPIGWMIGGLTALLLLIEDYYTYENGGKSKFEGMWKWLDELKVRMNQDGTLDKLKQSFDEIVKSTGDVITNLIGIFDEFAKLAGYTDFKGLLGDSFINSMKVLADALKVISGNLDVLNGVMTGDWSKIKAGSQKSMEGGNDAFKSAFGAGDKSGSTPKKESEWDKFTNKVYDFWENFGKKMEDPGSWFGGGSGSGVTPSAFYTAPGVVTKPQVSIQNSYKIYGNDPYLTGVEVKRQTDGFYTREFQGVFL